MTRAEHVAWAKERALAYLDGDDADRAAALTSLTSDLGTHRETWDHDAIEVGTFLFAAGHLGAIDTMRDFIEGVR